MKCVCVCVCWCYLEERNSIERDRIRERYHLGSMELRDLSIVLIEKFLFLLIFPLLFSCFFYPKILESILFLVFMRTLKKTLNF